MATADWQMSKVWRDGLKLPDMCLPCPLMPFAASVKSSTSEKKSGKQSGEESENKQQGSLDKAQTSLVSQGITEN